MQIQLTSKGKILQNACNEFNTINKFRIIKRYKLLKLIRSLIDPVHLEGAHSVLFTLIKIK